MTATTGTRYWLEARSRDMITLAPVPPNEGGTGYHVSVVTTRLPRNADMVKRSYHSELSDAAARVAYLISTVLPGDWSPVNPPVVVLHGVTIVKTEFAQALGRNMQPLGRQCWAARTADGVWDFQREDSPGTPWLIYHRPSVADGSCPVPVDMAASLKRCAEAVAKGWADKELARRKKELEALR